MLGAGEPAQYGCLLYCEPAGNVFSIPQPVVTGRVQALSWIRSVGSNMIKILLLKHVFTMQPGCFFQRTVPAYGSVGRHFGIAAVTTSAAQPVYQAQQGGTVYLVLWEGIGYRGRS